MDVKTMIETIVVEKIPDADCEFLHEAKSEKDIICMSNMLRCDIKPFLPNGHGLHFGLASFVPLLLYLYIYFFLSSRFQCFCF